MRIVIVSFLPEELENIKGGVESATLNLLDGFELLNSDIRIKVIALSASSNKKVNYNSVVEIEYFKKRSSISLLDYLLGSRKINEIISDFDADLIHIQASGPHLLRFIFYNKERIIITQHGVMRHELKTKKSFLQKMTFLFKYIIERYYYPRFQNLIFISKYNRTCFPGRLSGKNFEIIPNAGNIKYFGQVDVNELNKRLIYIGGIYNGKNLLLLIKALKSLNRENIHFELSIVGDYTDNLYRTIIETEIENSDIKQNIKFYGWQSKLEVQNLLKSHSIFVLPSKQEALPMSIIEAMTFKRIVVASAVGGIPELINNKINGFVFSKDNQDELISVLKEIFYKKFDLRRITEQAGMDAIENYYPSIVAEKTYVFYEKLLKANC